MAMRETKLRMLTALAVVAAVASITLAAVTGTTAIKERQKAMEDIRQAMTVFGAIAKKEAPFDAEVVKASAETIANRLNTAADLFPDGSDKGDVETWAKPEIWSDRENFQKGLQAAAAAAVAMQSVTDGAAFGPALGALGNGCKTCHDTYRRPKQ
jgi:cytochrome c556